MKLTQKTILITGGTSGIGLELARQLRQKGNTVIVTGRDAARLAQAAQAVPGLHTFQSDVSDCEQIAALHARVMSQFPTLDVLINNAGVMRKLNLNDARGLRDVTKEIEINLCGPVRMIQQFLPHLKTREAALIVNVSSALAFVPMPIAPVYSATKAALHAYSQALRVQLRDTRVTVVELAPPGVETPLFRGEEFGVEMKNQKAMAANALAARTLRGIEAGKTEIRPGISNLVKFMSRLAPGFLLKQLSKI